MKYKSRKYWRNDRFSIFTIDEGRPWYRGGLGIFRIMEEVGQRGRVIFHGSLPFDDGRVKLGEGETYEVVEIEYGTMPDCYSQGTVIVRFRDCRMRRYWVSGMVALRAKDVEHVEGYVEVECEIEWNEPLETFEYSG